MSQRAFRPWLRPAQLAVGLLAAAAVALAGGFSAARGSPEPHVAIVLALALGLALAIASLLVGRRAWVRWRGLWVERRAREDVRKLLAPGWSMQQHRMSTNGDVDLVLRSDDRQHNHVIEIKSHRVVHIARRYGVFGGFTLKLRGGDGSAALAQARRNAALLRGSPVLWFPCATPHDAAEIDDVLVVRGPAKVLLKFLNARRSWFD